MKRYIILILACCGLYKVLTTRLIDLRVHKICPLVQTSEEISEKEANVFFKQWAEYKKQGYIKKVPENFAFDEVNMADRIPWLVKLWMDKHCINPKRFYYTEQRFRAILKASDMQKHTQSVIKILSSQMADNMDEAKKQWYRDLIAEQEQMVKIEGVTDRELHLLDGREEEVRELLN